MMETGWPKWTVKQFPPFCDESTSALMSTDNVGHTVSSVQSPHADWQHHQRPRRLMTHLRIRVCLLALLFCIPALGCALDDGSTTENSEDLLDGSTTSPSLCGDGVCEDTEDPNSCPQDCVVSGVSCGDGQCAASEDAQTCPADCEQGSTCGDGVCQQTESASSCPQDCAATSTCGDGVCDGDETTEDCAQDCGEAPVCGDGVCTPGETSVNCAQDCGEAPVCGDGVCAPGETSMSCAQDCGGCGDGVCDDDESDTSCPADCAPGCADSDSDGVCDTQDICPNNPDAAQIDQDNDGLGDACDPCPLTAENDGDDDGVCAPADNCPTQPNTDQADADLDGLGDACDPCPTARDIDTDADGTCDVVDNCPAQPNADQTDADEDGQGDACDPCALDPDNDADGDGLCGDLDNCPAAFNQNQLDVDLDGFGDACDPCPEYEGADLDADTICDVVDNCLVDANADQADADEDGLGDACDPCPQSIDADLDGVCDDVDVCLGGDDTVDDDNDGVPDACADCPWMTQEQFVVTYHNLFHYNGEGPFSFQIILSDDGTIAFQYEHMHNLAGPVIGLESPQDDFSLMYEFETINIQDDVRLRFTPQSDAFDLTTSYDPTSPPFEWIPHNGAPNLGLGDDVSQVVDLPFTFPFMGRDYDQLNVASNGYVWFGPSSDDHCCLYLEQSLPTNHTWEGMIAGAWDDLNPPAGGHIHAFQHKRVCAVDCEGTPNGPARQDECGTCTRGATGLTPDAEKDCEGVCFGVAELDQCGACFGGTTGRQPEEDDLGCGCFEGPPQAWYPDVDGDGLGAGTPVVDCRQNVPSTHVLNSDDLEPDCATNDEALCGGCGLLDCTDICGGGAFIDACNLCAGGNTGIVPGEPDDLDGDGFADDCSGPDLVVDRDNLSQDLSIQHIFVDPDDCYIQEGCVGGPGDRKVLRFSTMIGNIGNADLTLGAAGSGDAWIYDACHDHFHYEDYAFYQLFTEAGHELSSVGYKNGWCVLDLADYNNSGNACNTYTCGNQGISAGCADIYHAALDCQWIDVTSIPDGTYLLRVTTNPHNNVYELDHTNNTAEILVEISGDTVTMP